MAGVLVLAIILGPPAFGVWAVGLGLVAALQAVTRSGLGASLLRRAEPPTQSELNAVFTFQIWFGLAVATTGLAIVFGLLPALGTHAREAEAICLALLALPISAPRVAPACVLERELQNVPLSIMDVRSNSRCTSSPSRSRLWARASGASRRQRAHRLRRASRPARGLARARMAHAPAGRPARNMALWCSLPDLRVPGCRSRRGARTCSC